jgi:hypothetical protein
MNAIGRLEDVVSRLQRSVIGEKRKVAWWTGDRLSAQKDTMGAYCKYVWFARPSDRRRDASEARQTLSLARVFLRDERQPEDGETPFRD